MSYVSANLWFGCLLVTIITGCSYGSGQATSDNKKSVTQLPAAVAPTTSGSVTSPRSLLVDPGITEAKTLSQNWTDKDASWFYNTPQGSYLIPYEWFLNLEQADSEILFLDPTHIRSLGYLPRSKSDDNPDALPIGFVKDENPFDINDRKEGSYLGLTCAACHTGQVNFAGKTYLIDGAPTNGNFEKLQRTLVAAIQATLENKAKFNRFASKVVGDQDKLREELKAELERRTAYNKRNLPNGSAAPFGHGRVDAFGAIMNEVAVRFVQVPGNDAPANAPVSYPVLWDTPQHDFVQWNGAAPNDTSDLAEALVGTKDIGALGRNTGEVFGVFGEIDASKELPITALGHYPNSAKRDNLIKIEDKLKTLWSPQWPDEFPKIDEAAKAKGEFLFQSAHCTDCHLTIDRTSEKRQVIAQLKAVKTDPTMATNFKNRKGKTGFLQGRIISPPSLKLFGADAPVGLMLEHLVQRAIIRSSEDIVDQGKEHIAELLKEIRAKTSYQISSQVPKGLGGLTDLLTVHFGFSGIDEATTKLRDITGGFIKKFEDKLKAELEEHLFGSKEPELTYKARPLNGIWASAPYLHNGSIPNLDELLKMDNERSKDVFKLGSREFDPIKVGFKTDVGEDFNPKLTGNDNTGHSFGNADGKPFTAEERKQLIEYLKSL